MKLNWESPAHFENRIKPRGYVRRITCSTMHENLVTTGTGVRKNTSVPCGFSSVKIQKFMGFFFFRTWKNLNFIYSILCNALAVCFAAIELVIVLAGFL